MAKAVPAEAAVAPVAKVAEAVEAVEASVLVRFSVEIGF